jgi:hypothetical protein
VAVAVSILAAASAIICGCGGDEGFGDQGLAAGDDALSLFIRGCQHYFRGSLSKAREDLNGVVYRYPDSPLADDARLAVRRIESDLSGTEIPDTSDSGSVTLGVSVVVVGSPRVSQTARTLAQAFAARGGRASVREDEDAPNTTLVLYSESYRAQAEQVADSLSGWLSRPDTVLVQPGGQMTATVVPGYEGVVVLVGDQAVPGPDIPSGPDGD